MTKRVEFFPFWKRRFYRLYPPYLVALAGSIILSYVGKTLPYQSASEFGVDLLSLLTQTQNLTGAAWRVGNGVFWSLALEEQLYLLYFPLLAMRKRWGWRSTLVVVMAVNFAWIASAQWLPPLWKAGWLLAGPAYWFPWALGAIAVEAWVGTVALPRWTSSLFPAVFTMGLAYLLPPNLIPLVVTISFFFVLRFAVVAEEKRGSPPTWILPLLRLGAVSYSIYLVHNPAFIVSKRLLLPLGLPLELILILRFLSGVVAGLVLYHLVEKQALKVSS